MPPEAIEEALPSLAVENGLVPDEGGDGAPAVLPAERPLLGVVTEVDAKADLARVAFAPGLRGAVHLRDVRWARTPNPARYPVPVRSITKVFAPGDVAPFVLPAPGDGAKPTDEPRVLLHQEPAVEGALFSFEMETGAVLAMVGGYDFARSEFNRVTQARRQPGSAFKPMIYGTALTRGWTPTSTIVDRPLVYEDPESGFVWRPGNYKGRFLGKLTLRAALGRSVNNATIHLLNEVGVDEVIAFSRAVGIESRLERNLSLALGASSVSLLELTRAYAVFPAQGRLVTPRFITRVLDAEGNVLLENVALGTLLEEPPTEEPVELEPAREPAAFSEDPEAEIREELAPGHVLSPVDAFLATDMLHGVVVDPEGTGKQARALRRPLGGKTGTTNEQGDAWFIGFSPDLMAGVWVGYDEKRVLGKGETGGMAALPIWIDFMRAALADRPRRDFPVPDGIVFARVDRATGLLAGPASRDTYFQAYAEGTEPTDTSDGAVTASERDRLLRLDAF
jgi:penicillin-binding protein 1A